MRNDAKRALGFDAAGRNNMGRQCPYPAELLRRLGRSRVRGQRGGDECVCGGSLRKLETVLQKQPDYAEAMSVIGMIDAALGRKEDALREGRRAVELLPVTKDVMTGSELLRNLALILRLDRRERTGRLIKIAAALQGPGHINVWTVTLAPVVGRNRRIRV